MEFLPRNVNCSVDGLAAGDSGAEINVVTVDISLQGVGSADSIGAIIAEIEERLGCPPHKIYHNTWLVKAYREAIKAFREQVNRDADIELQWMAREIEEALDVELRRVHVLKDKSLQKEGD